MKSDLGDLERDIPTTPADTESLREVKSAKADVDALQVLFDALPREARRQRRTTSQGWKELEL